MGDRLTTVVRGWLQRRRAAREMDDELAFHIDMETRANIERGLSPLEARRVALRDFGCVEPTKEEVRDVRATWLDALWQDIRSAGRSVSRRPVIALTAVAMLGLAIGLTTAMFTVADALFLRPVPFADPDDLAFVYMGNEHGGRTTVSPAVLAAWQESEVFAAAESAVATVGLIGKDDTLTARGIARVTPGIFDLLGDLQPIQGRLFDRAEVRAGIYDRVLVSEELWRTRYQSDADIVGRTIVVDGEQLAIIGVLPDDFRFPEASTAIWRPIDPRAIPPSASDERFRVYVRFASNMPRADAVRIAGEVAQAADSSNANLYLHVEPLAEGVVDENDARAMPLLTGAVLLVFLVLCANVSSLLLARMTTRQHELRIQAALGAPRGRLMRQSIAESTILAVLGAGAGVVVAWGLVWVARGYLPEAFLLRTLNSLDLDARALAVTSLSAVAATAVAGLLPAWIGTRTNNASTLPVSDRGGTESRASRTVTRTLLVVEIALACTLLVSATLLVRSFINLTNADRGLDVDHVLGSTVILDSSAFPDQASRRATTQMIEEQIRQLPGVAQVTWTYGLPPRRVSFSFGHWHSDMPDSPTIDMRVDRYRVGPEFFALYGIPLLRGRSLEVSDPDGSVVIGERLARTFWRDQDPVGRTFTFEDETFRVVGVAREIHYPSLDTSRDRPEFYEPLVNVPTNAMISIRCAGACPNEAVVRQQVVAAHPAIRVVDVQPLAREYLEPLARPRATAAVGSIFAATALLASAGGLYSVLSYAVARRRREFGIRSALGASPAQIRHVVLREGAVVTILGLAFGTVASWAFGRLLTSLQYGVTLADPVTWVTVLVVLASATLAACWRPGRQAMRVEPAGLLREE